MPKLKRVSSAHVASQAKRWKKNQRELQREGDLPRRQEQRRRERDVEAHRNVWRDPVRRQQEQEQNTDAHRRVRMEDPEKRRAEQERDTAARRQVHLEDPERRQREQERNTAAHQVARTDPVTRMNEQRSDQERRREARADPQYRTIEQQTNNTRRQQVHEGRQASLRALNYQPDNFLNTTSVGLLNVQCQKCGALKFNKETEGLCCSKGKVKLDAFPQLQPFLQHLYEGTDSEGKHFLSNIRKYNCAFQMTSFGCNETTMSGFNPSFRIQGQVYHLIGTIVPTAGESPKFAQIYFIDNRESEVAASVQLLMG